MRYLSEGDKATLQAMLTEHRSAIVNRSRRPPLPRDGARAPYAYAVLTPPGGVPGAGYVGTGTLYPGGVYPSRGTGSGTGSSVGFLLSPGVADCSVYRVLRTNKNVPQLRPAGFKVSVHNLSTNPVPGSEFVSVTQDKHGSWLLSAGAPSDQQPILPPVFCFTSNVCVEKTTLRLPASHTGTGTVGTVTVVKNITTEKTCVDTVAGTSKVTCETNAGNCCRFTASASGPQCCGVYDNLFPPTAYPLQYSGFCVTLHNVSGFPWLDGVQICCTFNRSSVWAGQARVVTVDDSYGQTVYSVSAELDCAGGPGPSLWHDWGISVGIQGPPYAPIRNCEATSDCSATPCGGTAVDCSPAIGTCGSLLSTFHLSYKNIPMCVTGNTAGHNCWGLPGAIVPSSFLGGFLNADVVVTKPNPFIATTTGGSHFTDYHCSGDDGVMFCDLIRYLDIMQVSTPFGTRQGSITGTLQTAVPDAAAFAGDFLVIAAGQGGDPGVTLSASFNGTPVPLLKVLRAPDNMSSLWLFALKTSSATPPYMLTGTVTLSASASTYMAMDAMFVQNMSFGAVDGAGGVAVDTAPPPGPHAEAGASAKSTFWCSYTKAAFLFAGTTSAGWDGRQWSNEWSPDNGLSAQGFGQTGLEYILDTASEVVQVPKTFQATFTYPAAHNPTLALSMVQPFK